LAFRPKLNNVLLTFFIHFISAGEPFYDERFMAGDVAFLQDILPFPELFKLKERLDNRALLGVEANVLTQVCNEGFPHILPYYRQNKESPGNRQHQGVLHGFFPAMLAEIPRPFLFLTAYSARVAP
jgi:hypothetical protein